MRSAVPVDVVEAGFMVVLVTTMGSVAPVDVAEASFVLSASILVTVVASCEVFMAITVSAIVKNKHKQPQAKFGLAIIIFL